VTPAHNGAETVRLIVPASLEYVRIVRLTASGIASRLGFDIDEVENLRVAIDELASMVVERAAPGELELSFTTVDNQLAIEGRAPARTGTIETGVEELTAQILNAVIDKYELRNGDGTIGFWCVRRLPAE
jgi:serine/threonine-protein kinase RsbW